MPGIAEAHPARPGAASSPSAPSWAAPRSAGPADRLFQTLGGEASALGVARHYQERYPGLVDALVIDILDADAGGADPRDRDSRCS